MSRWPFVHHDPVCLRRDTGISGRAASVHRLHITSRRAASSPNDVSYHQFADDTQLLVTINSMHVTPAINYCTAAVYRWFLLSGLQLIASSRRSCFWAPLLSFSQSPPSPVSTSPEAPYWSHGDLVTGRDRRHTAVV